MPIILLHDYEHTVLMTLGGMRDKGIAFPTFDTISRELPDMNVARLSDCLQKLKWKGLLGPDDGQYRLSGAGVEEYQNHKRAGFK